MKKTTVILAALFSLATLNAQDLDPTVEVSRAYEGKLMEVHKPVLDMAVPDTLHSFGLKFDYSVFESPYKGSYEFSPYMLDIRPASENVRPASFYLMAGAGYTLHPHLDVLWSPIAGKPFRMDVYATHRSYVGEYRAAGKSSTWKGYDLISKAGADMGYDWDKTALDLGVSYYGIAVKDCMKSRSYDAVDADFSIGSKSLWPKQFMYNVSVDYRFAEDKVCRGADEYLQAHDFGVEASLGPNFSQRDRLLFDLGIKFSSYSGAAAFAAGRFTFVPHYVYKKGILSLDAGLRVSAVLASGDASVEKGQIVYPDIHLSLGVIPDAMRLRLDVGGGDRLNTFASLVASDHHVDSMYGIGGYASLMDVTIERIRASLGIEGRISGFFSYAVSGGYVNCGNTLFEAVERNDAGDILPALRYGSCQRGFASAEWNLDFRSFRFEGVVGYEHTWDMPSDPSFLKPSSWTGDVSFMYNWNQRIYAGADCAFASARRGSSFEVPGYADLGISAEYVLNRRISFWARGGNLLNMEIQRDLLYAEKGMSVTAGICLTL